MRGRKPTPTAIKIAKGNPGRRPLNTLEPTPALGLPDPPEHLSVEAVAEWRRVAPDLHRAGLLSFVDRAALAVYCQAYGRWVQAEAALRRVAERSPGGAALIVQTTHGNWIPNPLLGIANKAYRDVLAACAEFGMTPSARSRVTAEHGHEQEEDPAARFFQ